MASAIAVKSVYQLSYQAIWELVWSRNLVLVLYLSHSVSFCEALYSRSFKY